MIARMAVLGLCVATGQAMECQVTFTHRPPLAVVLWDEADSTFAQAAPAVVLQHERTFRPGVVVVPPGGAVEVRNDDDQRHNVFTEAPEQQLSLDLGLNQPGESVRIVATWAGGTPVRFGCKIHPQMQLWVLPLASARHQVGAVVDQVATLRLPGVGPGSRLVLWSPRSDRLELPLDRRTVPLTWKGRPCGEVRVTDL